MIIVLSYIIKLYICKHRDFAVQNCVWIILYVAHNTIVAKVHANLINNYFVDKDATTLTKASVTYGLCLLEYTSAIWSPYHIDVGSIFHCDIPWQRLKLMSANLWHVAATKKTTFELVCLVDLLGMNIYHHTCTLLTIFIKNIDTKANHAVFQDLCKTCLTETNLFCPSTLHLIYYSVL